MNWYVYCANNPLNFIDPSGLKDVWSNSESNMVTTPTSPDDDDDDSSSPSGDGRDDMNFFERWQAENIYSA